MGHNGRQTGVRDWAVFGELLADRVFPEGHPQEGQHVPLPVNKAEVEDFAADVANVLVMVGGTASFGADRMVDPFTGMWITTAVYAQWHSYAPSTAQPAAPRGKRGGEQAREAEPRSATAAAAEREGTLERSEFQQPGPEPQEPDEDERDPDEFIPLSPEEQRAIERDAALAAQEG